MLGICTITKFSGRKKFKHISYVQRDKIQTVNPPKELQAKATYHIP